VLCDFTLHSAYDFKIVRDRNKVRKQNKTGPKHRDPVLTKKRTGTLAFMASAGARAYNGGLGAPPPLGPRGKAPGQGSSPTEVEKSILKCRLQIFAVKCDENPTMSTLLFFHVQLCSYRS